MVGGYDSTDYSDWFSANFYLITKTLWTLHDAVPTSNTLTPIDVAPTGTFRCIVTIAAVAGHTTVAGHVYINAEDLNFLVAGSKISTTNLTSLPTITKSSGLDCKVTITCIDSGGAPIYKTSNTTIACMWEDAGKGYWNSSAIWTLPLATIYTASALPQVNSSIKYDKANPTDPSNGQTYIIKYIESTVDEDGNVPVRILKLSA